MKNGFLTLVKSITFLITEKIPATFLFWGSFLQGQEPDRYALHSPRSPDQIFYTTVTPTRKKYAVFRLPSKGF